MSLAHRIIPTILCRGRELVKGKGFVNDRKVGVAAQAVRIHASRGVDEVVLLDVDATREGRGPDLALVAELAEVLFAPLAVGGGIRSLEDVKDLLRAGADKVVIGSAAMEDQWLLQQVASTVGSQALVVAMDVRGGHCWTRNGTLRWPSYYAANAGLHFQRLGAGEILLQSIERDGSMSGYDLDLIRAVAPVLDIPVIASGGCSGYENMREAIEAGAWAVAAGALFQFTDCTPRGAARYLAGKGIEVRL